MKRANMMRTAAVGAACAAVGAGAGIAGSAASTNHSTRASGDQTGARPHRGWRGPMGGPAVHAEAIVLNKARDGFVTLTTDSGKVKSIDGDQLTITEGVGKVTYRDVTLTIPSGATVMRDFKTEQLSDLKAGDFVHVDSSSQGTNVMAVDPSAKPPRMRDGRFHGPPPGGPGGPPPGSM